MSLRSYWQNRVLGERALVKMMRGMDLRVKGPAHKLQLVYAANQVKATFKSGGTSKTFNVTHVSIGPDGKLSLGGKLK